MVNYHQLNTADVRRPHYPFALPVRSTRPLADLRRPHPLGVPHLTPLLYSLPLRHSQ
jgi:hypothetical protein